MERRGLFRRPFNEEAAWEIFAEVNYQIVVTRSCFKIRSRRGDEAESLDFETGSNQRSISCEDAWWPEAGARDARLDLNRLPLPSSRLCACCSPIARAEG